MTNLSEISLIHENRERVRVLETEIASIKKELNEVGADTKLILTNHLPHVQANIDETRRILKEDIHRIEKTVADRLSNIEIRLEKVAFKISLIIGGSLLALEYIVKFVFER